MFFQKNCLPWESPEAQGRSDINSLSEALRDEGARIEEERRERRVLATLLHTVNDHDSAATAVVLDRVVSSDLIHPGHADLFQVVVELHTAGKFVDRTVIESHDSEPARRIDDVVLGEVLESKPLTDLRQLKQMIEAVVRAGALNRARASLRHAAEHVRLAEQQKAASIPEVADVLRNVAAELSSANQRAADVGRTRTLKEELEAVIAGLANTHGKEFLGLPTKTLPTFDRYTLGVRGFNLLAAAPGEGKTSLGLQVGIDIVENNPDAAFVFFSFEMSRQDMYRRLISMMSGLPWKTVMLGSGLKVKTFNSPDGLMFADEDRQVFNEAVKTLKRLGERVIIIDQQTLEMVDGDAMSAAITAGKKKTGADRAYVLVDNLQAMPFHRPNGVPWSNDVERDNHVIGQLLRLQRSTGDAFMLISEQNKEGMGRDLLKSTRGTARGVYSPDSVFILQAGVQGRVVVDEEARPTPVELKIIKGRDGTFRGKIPLMFDYQRSTFNEQSADDDDIIHGASP